MGGKKGRSGRRRKYRSHPLIDKIRKQALEYYYEHKEARAKYMHDYHKRIKDYSIKHNITFEEAMKKVGKQVRR